MGMFDRLRRRSGLVIVAIGFALGAFILGEFFTSGSVLLNGDADAVGFINGEKVSSMDFNREMEDMRLNNPQMASMGAMQLSQMVWNQQLQNRLIGELQEELGFTISSDELWDAIISNPSIQSMEGFRDQNTGQFNVDLLRNALANLRDNKESSQEATDQYLNWVNFEGDVRNEALSNKFYAAVKQGLRTPVSLYQHSLARQTRQAEIEWAGLLVSGVEDSLVDVSEADYKAVYAENKESFKVINELRDIYFANFPIEPSQGDREGVIAEMNSMQAELVVSVDDSAYVMANSDVPFQDAYFRLDQLDESLKTAIDGQSAGYVSGPIEIGPGYQIVKVMNRRNMPDSVSARHILVAFAGAERSQATRDFAEAKTIADSILAGINSGALNFNAVATTFNDDVAAGMKGGDLGWFKSGMMAKPFEDYCFRNASGSTGLVFTNFGYHIINVTGQRGAVPSVRLAQVFRRVNVSKETEQGIYTQAAEFAKAIQTGEDAQAVANRFNVALLPNKNTSATDQTIIGLGESREVIRWAFNADRNVNEVGVINNNYQSYVVTQLTAVYEPGYKSVQELRDELRMLATNRAKVLYLKGQWEANKPASQKATVSLSSVFLPGAGREAVVLGMALGSSTGYSSELIEGLNGVYQFNVLNIIENPGLNTNASDVAAQNNQLRQRVQSALFQALIDGADVQDYRGKFY
ncbi:MAG: peptidylprolyl isomerase [Schleiferiaceae bacterium]|nr:peptidylprolyl isomerase [Schleiferiaceae bacterium]